MPKEIQARSEKEAKSKGVTEYFTGKPCKYGHISYRNTQRLCKDCIKIKAAKYKLKHKKELATKQVEYNKNNIDRKKTYDTEYRIKNKSRIAKQQKEYGKNNKNKTNARHLYRYQDDIGYKLSFVLRGFMQRILMKSSGKSRVSSRDLGYSKQDLIDHMNNLFIDDMSWGNHGEWHIDHIKPISLFIKEGVKDPKIINALSNLQPLWAKDNLSKSAKYDG